MTASRRLAPLPLLLIGLAALAILALIPWAVQSQSSVVQAQSSETEVARDWALVPDGVGPGDSFRLLIQTTNWRDATATDIADYNTFVQDLVAAGHTDIQEYSGDFRVVGCTAAVDAVTNTSMDGGGVPVYWLNGPKVADNYYDFYDSWWDPPRFSYRNEQGGEVSVNSNSGYMWTGCEDDGTISADDAFLGASSYVEWAAAWAFYGNLKTTTISATYNISGDPLQEDLRRTGHPDIRGRFFGISGVFRVAGDRPSAVQSSIDAARDAGAVHQVLTDWPLVPDERLAPGSRFRLLFVTDRYLGARRDTFSTDIYSYHSHVWNQIDEIGHQSIQPYRFGFRVIGATADSPDYIANASLGTPDVPIYWLNGDRVANNLAGFTDLTAPPQGTPWSIAWDEEAIGRLPNGEPNEFPGSFTDHDSFVATGIRGYVGHLGNQAVDAGFPNFDHPRANPLASVSLDTFPSSNAVPFNPYYYGISPTFEVVPCYPGLQLLCAQMTADAWSTDDDFRRGYSSSRPDSSLLQTEFELDGTTYTVGHLATFVPHADTTGDLDLSLMVTPALPTADLADLELRIASLDRSFLLSNTTPDITTVSGSAIYTWEDSDVGWFEGMGDFVILQQKGLPPVMPIASGSRHVPEDVGSGEAFRLMFVTHAGTDAESSDIDYYNEFVQDDAAGPYNDPAIRRFARYFRAVASGLDVGEGDIVDARDNAFMNGDGFPIYWTGGGWDQEAGKVADDYADFFDGNWDDEENPSYSFGNLVRTSGQLEVWTGTDTDGSASSANSLAQPFNDTATTGRPGSADGGPIDANLTSVDTVLPLYGISPLFVVAGEKLLGSPRNVRGVVTSEGGLALSWDPPRGYTSTDLDFEIWWRNPENDFSWELLESVVSTAWTDLDRSDRIYGVRALLDDGRKSARVRYLCSERTGCVIPAAPPPPEIGPFTPGVSERGTGVEMVCVSIGDGNAFFCRFP